MIVRGKGVQFSKVNQIIAETSTSLYAGHVIIHRDAKPVGSVKDSGYGWQGRIVVDASDVQGSRRSWSGRRMPVACWHAYRDVIRAILTVYPDAVIVTAQARYEGLKGFEETYPATGRVNIGSMMQPAYFPELCDCIDYE